MRPTTKCERKRSVATVATVASTTARTLIPNSAHIMHKLLFLKNHQQHTVLDRAFLVKNS